MNRVNCCLCIAAAVLIVCGEPALAQTATECERGDNYKRILACTQLLATEQAPERRAQLYRSRGWAYMLQQPELAEKDFSAALDILPSDVWSLRWRALVRLNLHKYDLALTDTDHLIDFGKNARESGDYQLRCHIFKKHGQMKEAITACSEAINTWRDGALYAPDVFYEDRGEVYLLDGQLDQAIADFNKALSIDKRLPNAALLRGKALLAKGDYAAALDDFLGAHEWDDAQWLEVLSKRGLAYEALGRRPEAIADFQRALRIKPGLAEARDGLSRLGAVPLPWWHFW